MSFQGFRNGNVQIYGSNDGSGKYTNQTTRLVTSTNSSCIQLGRNTGMVRVSDIACVMSNYYGGTGQFAIDCFDTSRAYIEQNYFMGMTNHNSGGVRSYTGNAYVYQNYFNSIQQAITVGENGKITAYDNGYTGIIPLYGHRADQGTIHRRDKVVLGTTENSVVNGGLLVESEGMVLPIVTVLPYFLYGFGGMGPFADFTTSHNSVLFSDTDAGLTAMFYVPKAGSYKFKMIWRPDSANTSKTMSGLIYLDTTTDSVAYSTVFNSLNWDLAIPNSAFGYTVSTYGTAFSVSDNTLVKASYRKDDNAGGAAGYLRIEAMILVRQ